MGMPDPLVENLLLAAVAVENGRLSWTDANDLLDQSETNRSFELSLKTFLGLSDGELRRFVDQAREQLDSSSDIALLLEELECPPNMLQAFASSIDLERTSEDINE